MATLYIAEYPFMGSIPSNCGQMPLDPPIVEQIVPIGGGSVQSAFFHPLTQYLRLHTDATCSVLVGQNPTATMINSRMVANQTEYRAIPSGGFWKLAVIANV